MFKKTSREIPFSPTINIADGWNRLRKRSKPVV